MLAGVPVLVSEKVFLADDIRSHDAGWVVSDDKDAIIAGLRDAMNGSDRRARRARAAKAFAESQFDSIASTKLIIQKYQSIISGRPRKRAA